MTEKLKCISFPTNVRSPRIIREYLKVLIKYNFPKYDPDFEKEFIIALSREGAYGGNLDKLNETSKRTQGRVRYGYLKSFGFAYEDEGRNIIITPAGRAFADDSRDPHSVWLDQMVKWQIPNPHLDVRSGYGDFAIHPFITVLNILTKVGRLSKEEIGLFILTMKKNQDVPNTIARIRNYRDLENSE
ncbi:MAG: AlwI family type II restriction endonuclease, partial [Candidatus Heimdallarchaeota archaeon]